MSEPFVPTTTPNIERANRLLGLRSHPGFMDLLRLSLEIVQSAADFCADFGGWDAQQIVVLKVRMQAAKEHHELLIAKMQDAIRAGVEEDSMRRSSMPAKSPEDVLAQGDYVRQEVLTKFDEMDSRAAGSF